MLSIISPVFNEASHIAEFIDRCLSAAQACPVSSFELILVNDGSNDRSGEIIVGKIRKYPGLVKLVELSRNFGQQSAFHAGLSFASGDIVVTLDSDLQDPPELIPNLVEKMKEGFDLVYAKRVNRKGGRWKASGHTGLKSIGAFLFHQLMSQMKGNPIPRDVGEYRAMGRELVNHLLEFPEYMIFLPGLVAYIGFNVGFVEYVRTPRDDRAGVTLPRLTARALDALTTFSIMPINLISIAGLATWVFPAILLGWILTDLMRGRIPSSIVVVLLTAATAWCLMLSMLAIMAHYVGRIFLEVKQRPRYFVRRVFDKPDSQGPGPTSG